jgi:hypothetical protein
VLDWILIIFIVLLKNLYFTPRELINLNKKQTQNHVIWFWSLLVQRILRRHVLKSYAHEKEQQTHICRERSFLGSSTSFHKFRSPPQETSLHQLNYILSVFKAKSNLHVSIACMSLKTKTWENHYPLLSLFFFLLKIILEFMFILYSIFLFDSYNFWILYKFWSIGLHRLLLLDGGWAQGNKSLL